MKTDICAGHCIYNRLWFMIGCMYVMKENGALVVVQDTTRKWQQ